MKPCEDAKKLSEQVLGEDDGETLQTMWQDILASTTQLVDMQNPDAGSSYKKWELAKLLAKSKGEIESAESGERVAKAKQLLTAIESKQVAAQQDSHKATIYGSAIGSISVGV